MVKCKKLLSMVLAVGMLTSMSTSVFARQIREFDDVRAYVGSETQVSSMALTKSNNSNAVFNYSGGNSSGDRSLVTAVIRNSNNASRGSCSAEKGNRKSFSTSAQAGYSYDLTVSKTLNGSSILVTGSWSPDSY